MGTAHDTFNPSEILDADWDRTMTRDEWYAEGVKRFGEDMLLWKFILPYL